MRLGTRTTAHGTVAFVEVAGGIVDLDAVDVGALIRSGADLSVPATPAISQQVHLVQPIVSPGTILCVGLNYHEHAREVGKEAPEHPTLFAKLRNAVVGPVDDIRLPQPSQSTSVDWEAELVIVIGRRVTVGSARGLDDAIFGYTVMNDVSVRDWQRRTQEWLQGKNFDRMTPIGPIIVTADEFDLSASHAVITRVDGETVQRGDVQDMIFDPLAIVAYVAQFMTLEPGDMIATGTPAGVGDGMDPPRYLRDGTVLETEIEGIGLLRNRCVVASPPQIAEPGERP